MSSSLKCTRQKHSHSIPFHPTPKKSSILITMGTDRPTAVPNVNPVGVVVAGVNAGGACPNIRPRDTNAKSTGFFLYSVLAIVMDVTKGLIVANVKRFVEGSSTSWVGADKAACVIL